MIEPKLKEGDDLIPLHQCNPDQCERLLNQMNDTLIKFKSAGIWSSIPQIETMIQMIEDRIDHFEQGFLKKPETKKKSFRKVRIIED